MIIQELTIQNKSGLHARPATLWVQTAGRFQSKIRLRKGEREIDGKSMLGILSLGLSAGSVVQLLVEGPDEAAAAEELTKLITDLADKGA
jgi:phosphocarrier protein